MPRRDDERGRQPGDDRDAARVRVEERREPHADSHVPGLARAIHEDFAPGRARRVFFEPESSQGFTNPMPRIPSRSPSRRISPRTVRGGSTVLVTIVKAHVLLRSGRIPRSPHE